MKIYTGVPGDSIGTQSRGTRTAKGHLPCCRGAIYGKRKRSSAPHLPRGIGFMRNFGYHISQSQFLRDLRARMQCALYACGISRKKYHCKSTFVKQGGAEYRTGPKNRG